MRKEAIAFREADNARNSAGISHNRQTEISMDEQHFMFQK